MKGIGLTIILSLLTLAAFSQRTISGYVYTESKEPLIGASVIVKGTDIGITTDFDGFFELEIADKKITLLVKYIGYYSQEKSIPKSVESLEIILKENAEVLSDIVVGNTRKDKKRKYRDGLKLRGRVSGMITKPKSESSTMTSPPPPPPVIEEVAYESPVDEIFAIVEEPVMMTIGGDDVADSYDMEILEAEKEYSVSETTPEKPSAGKLTAGIINDFSKWDLWQDIQENELETWRKFWGIYTWDRYPIQLTTQNGYPIINAKVSIKKGDETLWTTRTDNHGRAELWTNIFQEPKEIVGLKIEAEYNDGKYELDKVNTFHEGNNHLIIPEKCNINPKIDIAFVVDATGSMGDEINYLKSELEDVITRVKKDLGDADLRLGSVFYRDHGDEYLTRKSHFSKDINKTTDFINKQTAAGGGDQPEGVDDALEEALENLAWRDDATTKLLFLVLDAPPHKTDETKARLDAQIKKAAEWGIRIVPVACSGTDRSTEFLMRSYALAT
ncbi:MAG: carboxypeptidase-like regulatory domain-containing protein, partial [Saprospiraceae bacterium]